MNFSGTDDRWISIDGCSHKTRAHAVFSIARVRHVGALVTSHASKVAAHLTDGFMLKGGTIGPNSLNKEKNGRIHSVWRDGNNIASGTHTDSRF